MIFRKTRRLLLRGEIETKRRKRMRERYFENFDRGALEGFTSNPFVMFLAGVSAGFAAGVFFAPKSGAELRAQVSDSAAGVGERVKQRTSRAIPPRLRERARSTVEQVRSRTRRETPGRDIVDLLNEVDRDELVAMAGIEPVFADRIIRNRPYTRERELLQREVIPESAYQAVREALLKRTA
jgi:hypothetical protein